VSRRNAGRHRRDWRMAGRQDRSAWWMVTAAVSARRAVAAGRVFGDLAARALVFRRRAAAVNAGSRMAAHACTQSAGADVRVIGNPEMTGEMPAAEKAASAARECERRNEGGTGQRRREGGAPNGANHGPISLRFRWSRREAFGFNAIM